MLAYSPMNTVPMATIEEIAAVVGSVGFNRKRFGFLMGKGYYVFNARRY